MEGETEKNRKDDKHPPSYSLEWSLWQLLDSILPTGGFAHSFGLEAAIQARLVNDPEDLHTFVIQVLQNTGSLLLPFVYATTITPDIKTWHKLDKMLDATLTNEVARKASTTQGSALLRIAAAVFTELPSLKTMREQSLGGAISLHHAPIFGLVCGLLGLSPDISQRAYLFITLRDVISAATRLNLIGPQAGAVMQHAVGSTAEKVLMTWKDRDVEDACQTMPLIDAVQGCHGYLFSRMFCS
ncbi:hypothetical protein SOVF_179460 [Spinacia oleracea]|uniref:Urease accessory protein F n=1 Tax=Spinacia oleracea TaxID=3562 RepID=A0A9R0I653_SPIOL|nr:urease accessory protein F [Spinacia oleracea]XP_021843406.1 urease accessory protein F [Spinacia oleracea]XP_021843407.1 urease accessory protein F [Spinacia oleracea]KNA06607.1 hypothetical protein SOVF_179460 [Spinacia oleracea]